MLQVGLHCRPHRRQHQQALKPVCTTPFRQSAARSKERQKRELEELKANHKMLEYKRDAAAKEMYALSLAISHLSAETEVMHARVTAARSLGMSMSMEAAALGGIAARGELRQEPPQLLAGV